MDDLLLYVPRRYDVYKRTKLGGNNLGIWFAHDAITKLDVVIKLGVWQRNVDQYILLNEKCPTLTIPYIDSFHVKKFEALVTQKFDGTLLDLLITTDDPVRIKRIAEIMIKAYIDLAECGHIEQDLGLDNMVYNLYENDLIDVRVIDYGQSGDNIKEILEEFAQRIFVEYKELSDEKIDIITRVIYNHL